MSSWKRFAKDNPHRVVLQGSPDTPAAKRLRREVQKPDYDGTMKIACERAGVPLPDEKEYGFHDDRQWRFDYAWTTEQVALEIEGGVFTRGRHVRGKGYSGDMEKYNEAQLAGWLVLRCRPDQILTEKVFDWLRRAL